MSKSETAFIEDVVVRVGFAHVTAGAFTDCGDHWFVYRGDVSRRALDEIPRIADVYGRATIETDAGLVVEKA